MLNGILGKDRIPQVGQEIFGASAKQGKSMTQNAGKQDKAVKYGVSASYDGSVSTAKTDGYGNVARKGVNDAKNEVMKRLSEKYSNADIFVSDKAQGLLGDSQDYTGTKEYSIILSKEEMELLASDDPKDKEAQEALYAQIDKAMDEAGKLGDQIQSNENIADLLNVGVTMGNDGKFYYFARNEEGGFQVDSMESLMNTLLERQSAAAQESGE